MAMFVTTTNNLLVHDDVSDLYELVTSLSYLLCQNESYLNVLLTPGLDLELCLF